MSEFKCPKCGSTDIQWNEPLRYYSYQQCLKCGHRWNEALESYRSFEKLLDSIGIAAAKQIGDRKDTEDDLKDLDEEFETYVRTPKKAEFKQLASALGNTATETYRKIGFEVKAAEDEVSNQAIVKFEDGRGKAKISVFLRSSDGIGGYWWSLEVIQDLDAETNEQFIEKAKKELEYWVYMSRGYESFRKEIIEAGFRHVSPGGDGE